MGDYSSIQVTKSFKSELRRELGYRESYEDFLKRVIAAWRSMR